MFVGFKNSTAGLLPFHWYFFSMFCFCFGWRFCNEIGGYAWEFQNQPFWMKPWVAGQPGSFQWQVTLMRATCGLQALQCTGASTRRDWNDGWPQNISNTFKHMISIVVIIIIIIIIIIMFIICIMITDSSSSCAKVELMFVWGVLDVWGTFVNGVLTSTYRATLEPPGPDVWQLQRSFFGTEVHGDVCGKASIYYIRSGPKWSKSCFN